MVKKIGQDTLIRFGFFSVIWISYLFLVVVFNPILIPKTDSKFSLMNLFTVFLMFPSYITNIIQNIDKLDYLIIIIFGSII